MFKKIQENLKKVLKDIKESSDIPTNFISTGYYNPEIYVYENKNPKYKKGCFTGWENNGEWQQYDDVYHVIANGVLNTVPPEMKNKCYYWESVDNKYCPMHTRSQDEYPINGIINVCYKYCDVCSSIDWDNRCRDVFYITEINNRPILFVFRNLSNGKNIQVNGKWADEIEDKEIESKTLSTVENLVNILKQNVKQIYPQQKQYLTVKDLAEILKKYPDNTKIILSDNEKFSYLNFIETAKIEDDSLIDDIEISIDDKIIDAILLR